MSTAHRERDPDSRETLDLEDVMSGIHAGLWWGLGALLFTLPLSSIQAQQPPRPKRYIYVLHVVPRLYAEADWTEADNRAVGDHFVRLQKATEAGQVILAGRTDEPLDHSFGIVIFEAADDSTAAEFARTDPAVVAGAMTVEVHPFALALMKK